jgi:hypothetical protein
MQARGRIAHRPPCILAPGTCEAVPSVEVAKKIADVFEMTIDFLIGNNHNLAVDKKTLKRMQNIDKLDESTKEKLFFLIDNVVQNFKTKKAFAS